MQTVNWIDWELGSVEKETNCIFFTCFSNPFLLISSICIMGGQVPGSISCHSIPGVCYSGIAGTAERGVRRGVVVGGDGWRG